MRRKTLSAGVALLVIGVAASVSTGALASKSAVSKIAIATPAKANDYGWNQQGVSGARVAAKVNGATLTVNDGVGYDNTQAVLLRLARTHDARIFVAHDMAAFNGYSLAPAEAI